MPEHFACRKMHYCEWSEGMKRLKNGMHGMLWVVILGLGLYVMAKGMMIIKKDGVLEQRAEKWCAPALTFAAEKSAQKSSWFDLLTRELMPLSNYWESKRAYLPEESEETLIVKEETQTGETTTEADTENTENESRVTNVQETEGQTEERTIKQAVKKKKKKKKKASESENVPRKQAEQVDMAALQDFQTLLGTYYTVDASTTADPQQINADALLGYDMHMKKDVSVPQILIYHTHSQEAFADSKEGDISDTIVGMGNYLTELLENKYGYNVIHNTSVFDVIDGVLDRNTAYDLAETEISAVLAENPSIEVVIDLHRDGLDGEKLVTEIDGKQVAKIMFFNGLSRTARNGVIDYLPNPYIAENLAFSFQLQIKAQEYYPGFTRHIYLQSLRYNLHLKPKALLIEAGSQLNTVEEEKNAMEPLADILDRVLQG